MNLRSEILSGIPGIRYAFGTLNSPVPDPFQSVWTEKAHHWTQVHGVSQFCVTQARQECGEVDAFFTAEPLLPIAVRTADCVPILLAHQSGKKVAAIHAGWKGTLKRIVYEFFQSRKAHGEIPEEWVACLGPAIGPCCFEVGTEVEANFKEVFSNLPSRAERVLFPQPRRINLWEVNRHELFSLGLRSIDLLDECTQCSRDPHGNFFFHSARREKGTERQFSLIMIDKA